MTSNAALQKLMYLVSPALPVGAYAYSQGLEHAVDSGWLKTEIDVSNWIAGVLSHSVAELDLPILIRCYSAWQAQDIDRVIYWNHFLRAGRETRELLLEDDQLGIALQRLLVALEVPCADKMKKPTFAALFSLAGMHWQVPIEQLAQGFTWSWLENQVAAATKLVPFGQTQAQKVILALQPNIDPACEKAFNLKDEELGAGLPALAIASAQHERQYSRLFRS